MECPSIYVSDVRSLIKEPGRHWEMIGFVGGINNRLDTSILLQLIKNKTKEKKLAIDNSWKNKVDSILTHLTDIF